MMREFFFDEIFKNIFSNCFLKEKNSKKIFQFSTSRKNQKKFQKILSIEENAISFKKKPIRTKKCESMKTGTFFLS